MKFYKNFKLNSKIKLIAIGICIAVMVLVWAVNYIKINAAFPEAQEVIYTCEDALEVEGLNIELEESELMDNTEQTITKFTDENIITKLKKSKKDYRYIYIRLNVCNQSDEDKDIEALIYNSVMECMPSGWGNGASSECNKVKLKSGESTDIKMAYALNVPENADISKEEFHLVYRTYPQKIMFVLNI